MGGVVLRSDVHDLECVGVLGKSISFEKRLEVGSVGEYFFDLGEVEEQVGIGGVTGLVELHLENRNMNVNRTRFQLPVLSRCCLLRLIHLYF
jgi:hypothetical protein